MIYTVTFNPAIDYIVHTGEIELGRVNRTKNEEIYFGGKGINVSMVLSELGIKSKAFGFVAGFTGKAIEEGNPGPGGDAKGKGTKTDPYNIAGAVAQNNSGAKAWVKAFIVGQVENGAMSMDATTCQFGDAIVHSETANTNILIAASATETDYTKCMPVQLLVGEVRNALSVANLSLIHI